MGNVRFAIGTRVKGPHGLGTIVRYNGTTQEPYVVEHLQDAVTIAASVGGLDSIVNGFYSGNRYPYVVLFDNGYEDVYCNGSLEKIHE